MARHNSRFINIEKTFEVWREIGIRLRKAHIHNMDAIEILKANKHRDMVIYADPPYPKDSLSSHDIYLHDVSNEYHEELAIALSEHPGPVAVSGYRSPTMDKLYTDWYRVDSEPLNVTGNTSQDDKPKRVESLWLNPRTSTGAKSTDMNILTIGAVSEDVVVASETGFAKVRIGGVATIVAQELKRNGHNPVLYAPIADDMRAKRIVAMLEDVGIRYHSPVTMDKSCFYHCSTKYGDIENEIYHFPNFNDDIIDVKRLEPFIRNADLVVVETTLDPSLLNKVASEHKKVVIVVSHEREAHKLNYVHSHVFGITMNVPEMWKLGYDHYEALAENLDADHVMLTHGSAGWRCGDIRRPAVDAPENSDFNGAGDSAAAGFVNWACNKGDLVESVESYITNRLKFSANE